jgi:hypothetical protein
MNRIAIILLLVFILAWINQLDKISWASFNWFNIPNPEELYLLEYPKTVSGTALQFDAYSSKNYICSIYLCNTTLEKRLVEGRNRIELSTQGCGEEMLTILSCGESLIRFYSYKTNRSFTDEHIDAKFSAIPNKRIVGIDIVFSSKLNDAAYKNFEISVDGKTAIRPTYFFKNGEHESYVSEELHLEPGNHHIELRYENRTLDTKDVLIAGQPFPLQDVVDILLSLGIAALVRRKYKLDWLTSSLMFVGLSFSTIALQLQLQKNLGFNEWLLPLILALALVLVWKLKEKQ